jgi:hypothetical protein
VWQVAALGLIAGDLLVFAGTVHPLVPMQELADPSPATQFLAAQPGLVRTLASGSTPERPNRFLPVGVQEASGYSSLQPDRHLQYIARARHTEDRLLDLLNVRYLVQPNSFTPPPSFELTTYNPNRPLMSTSSRNAAARLDFRVPTARADHVRVISMLLSGEDVLQGEAVAQLLVYPTDGGPPAVLPVLAGVHTAAHTFDREEVRARVQHEGVRIAQTRRLHDAQGHEYQSHLYFAELALPDSMVVSRLAVEALHPTARFELFGLALRDSQTSQVLQLSPADVEKYAEVYRDESVVIYENHAMLPRAYLVPQGIHLTAPDDDALNELILTRMAGGEFDPERVVILEDVPGDVTLPSADAVEHPLPGVTAEPPFYTEAGSAAGTVRIELYTEQRVRLHVRAVRPAVLLLTDTHYPGWHAFLDTAEVPVYRANFLFRGVLVPPGDHTLEFTYRPHSFQAGLALTLLAALGLAALTLFAVSRR